MLLSIQFSFSDSRAFLEGEDTVLARPTWPSASPDTDFVRSFGSIRKRRLGGLLGWVGESAICEADRALRFPAVPTFRDYDGLRIPLHVAFRRFFFDGLAVGKFEIGLASETLSTYVTRKQTAALINHFLRLPIVIPALSPKAVSGELDLAPTSSELGQAARALARFYAASTIPHPPPIELQEWWLRCGAPLLFLVHEAAEEIQLPFRGRVVPHRKEDLPTFELFHLEIPHAGRSLQMWVLKLGAYTRYREARALKICLMRLHAEHESLRIVLQNIALKRINPTRRAEASMALQHYLNEATRKILGLEAEANHLTKTTDFAELARASQAFINPGDRDSLLETLKNLDMRLNIFHKVRDYVDTTIQINELNIQEVKMDSDQYNISGGQNVGFGRDARVYDGVFNQWQGSSASANLDDLAKELALLRAELKKQATTPEHDAAIGAVADAETAAKKGEGATVFQYLSKAGKWALDIARTIAVPVATEALKKAVGL